MREQPLDLRMSLAVLRRRWTTILLVAMLGLCGGIAYGALHIPEPHAAAEIVLPGTTPSGAQTTAADSETQAVIASSSEVLAEAASLTPPLTLGQLQHMVSASVEGNNVLRIVARAPTARQAVQVVRAVTSRYQKYVATRKLINGPTSVIEPAALLAPPSAISIVFKNALIGLAAGLLVGTVSVLIRARRDRRLRRRDEIAGAIGVPVLASMEAEQHKTVGDWIRLMERFDPSAMSAWTLRRVLRNLVPADLEGQCTIHVLSFVGDKAALAVGPELALFAAGSGIPTRLAPDENVALEPLIAACAALRSSNHADGPLTFGTETEVWRGPLGRPKQWDDDPALSEAHLVVSVVAVEPAHPHLTSIVGPTILCVSSGFVVVDDLARVALAATKAGLGIDGIVVVNPDPTDSTTGLLHDRMTSAWRVPDSQRQAGHGPPAHITGGATWRA